ncbi:Phosphoribosylamine/glycine ligase [Elusimicrobium minutum Pei191]|uniref:Phosphoribosylamine--glycine ligase n=1 Tax=Elusimicrobium minutum (strain Pei191) TaxID=445932 RepID=B2KCF3_ELUMP|nr:phosphoribosylamine--glycine ligase [Elusimicrobium minutum]ACC98074.1 Phosphoribosylamine/glycine ligase [Elusimicrobium minutum Pei191]
MKVLVIGSGGREHAIAWKLLNSLKTSVIYSTVQAAEEGKIQYVKEDISDKNKILNFCESKNIDLVVIGPEAPLAEGLADLLRENNIKVFGPVLAGAKLENSKEFSKEFMVKYSIPTAKYTVCKSSEEAKKLVAEHPLPLVVKADGLAAGKGVRICITREEAVEAVVDFMDKKIFGNAGCCVVIEEYLLGPELSVMGFVDGEHYLLMPISRDYKRLGEDNRGPNTGGMGAYCPVTEIKKEDIDFIKKNVFDKVVTGLKAEKIDFCGIIYAGIMITADGPKVLEFNCRLGDPEAEAILPMIKTDFLDILLACVDKKLDTIKMETFEGSSICVILASEGYPTNPKIGREITGLENVKGIVFHSGTRVEGNKYYTNGGRVLAVVETGANLEEVRNKVYYEIEKIRFEGMQFRKDVGIKK